MGGLTLMPRHAKHDWAKIVVSWVLMLINGLVRIFVLLKTPLHMSICFCYVAMYDLPVNKKVWSILCLTTYATDIIYSSVMYSLAGDQIIIWKIAKAIVFIMGAVFLLIWFAVQLRAQMRVAAFNLALTWIPVIIWGAQRRFMGQENYIVMIAYVSFLLGISNKRGFCTRRRPGNPHSPVLQRINQ